MMKKWKTVHLKGQIFILLNLNCEKFPDVLKNVFFSRLIKNFCIFKKERKCVYSWIERQRIPQVCISFNGQTDTTSDRHTYGPSVRWPRNGQTYGTSERHTYGPSARALGRILHLSGNKNVYVDTNRDKKIESE